MIYSRLVEGRFPNYKQVIPGKHQHRVPLTVGPFLAAVRQGAIMTDDESKRVRFQFAKKKLTLRAQGAETILPPQAGHCRYLVDAGFTFDLESCVALSSSNR